MGSKQLGSKFLKRSQICSHTPSALNAGAKRSGATCHYGHASMLLLGEGSEATEPYNKYDKIRPHSIRSQQFDQKVRPLSFRPEKIDLFTATPKENYRLFFLLPKRLWCRNVFTAGERRFGNILLPKRLPPSCCRNVLCRNVLFLIPLVP